MSLHKIRCLKNVIQDYAWGSPTAIPELLGCPNPANTPQAELWMGAHPKAPSKVLFGDTWVSLHDLIQKYPIEMLGKKTAENFKNQLPYLFKVLAAAKPLSIQAHPSQKQAEEGFARENQQQIPINAFNRNYKDDNHKPECICALTDFWALTGFRPIEQIIAYFQKLCPDLFVSQLNYLETNQNGTGLKKFFKAILTLEKADTYHTIAIVTENALKLKDSNDPVGEWIITLFDEYKYDIGVLSPMLLNLICLHPGQALFLPSGRLHAYLSGVGIELMANSDNVLRGGLTPKHVDIPELLKVLSFIATENEVLVPEQLTDTEVFYRTPAREFILSRIQVQKDLSYVSQKERSIEILLCTEGQMHIKAIDSDNEAIDTQKGGTVLVPSIIGQYKIEGKGVLFKAAVP